MGSLLTAAVPRLRSPEEANLRAPEAVVSLHLSFINAGAELIETNTFGANRRKLAGHYLEDELEQINSTAVKLARQAREISGRDVFIGGAIGPIGAVVSSAIRREVFAEQASILEGRGADLFMIETFYDLEELRPMRIAAVRSVSNLPIVALLTFDEGAETLAGVTAGAAAARLAELDIAAMGANHGAGPLAALTALEQMQADGRALAVLPNIGLASLAGGRVIYPHATPDYFAEFAAHARDLGARVIGGCCGTTPSEIAAISRARPSTRIAPLVLDVPGRRARADRRPRRGAARDRAGTGAARGRVRRLGAARPAPRRLERWRARALPGTRGLRWRAKFVDVNDNATARAGMNSLMISGAIERASGLETIPHLTTRDWTVLGLESLVLGAHAEGVRNVLAITGDPPEVGDYPGSRGVYEIDAIGLTRLISALNRGEDYNGRPIDAPTSFFVGVAVNPTADDLGLEADRFRQKIEAGAKFAMTQIVFDLDVLDRFAEVLGGEWPIPVLAGIFPLTSYRLALRLHNEVPGIIVPESLQRALEDAGPAAAEVGMANARELLDAAPGRCDGAYIVAPYRRPSGVLELLR